MTIPTSTTYKDARRVAINAVQNGIVIDYSNGDQQFIITKVTNLLGKLHSNTNQEIPEMIAMNAIGTGARGRFRLNSRQLISNIHWDVA